MKRLIFFLLLIPVLLDGQVVTSSVYFAPAVSSGSSSTLLDDLIAYWKMDNSSSPIVDEIGSNDGVAASTAANYSQTGRVGTSINFNYTPTYGAGTRFDVGDDVLQSNQVSISAWIYPTVGEDGFTIISNNYSTTHGYRLYCGGSGGGVAATIIDGAGHSTTIDSYPTNTLTANTWHHIVLVVDGTNATIYINTTQWTTGSFAYNIGYGTGSSVTVGANYDNNGSFGGRIDEIGIWSRALTSDERAELYNAGSGVTHPFN